MKVIPIALAPQYSGGSSTLARGLKITRADGQVFGFTDADRPVDVDGLTYVTGFEPSDLVSTSGLAVDNLEIKVFPDEDGGSVNRSDLMAGRWDNAEFEIFEFNHLAPGDGVNLLKRGTTGEVQVKRGSIVVEFRGIAQALQQPLGAVTSKTCRYALGQVNPDGTGCLVDLALWTFTYTVTAVASRHQFTCSAAVEADEFYKEGRATGTTGANAGFAQKVKDFAAGVFTLGLPLPYDVTIGDTFTFIAGDQKRAIEDCKNKFNNILNFGGEPHVPGQDLLLADPSV